MAKEVWNKFSLEYKHNDKLWSSDFYAKDWNDAEEKVNSIKQSLILRGSCDDYLVMEGDNLVFQEKRQVLGNDLHKELLNLKSLLIDFILSEDKYKISKCISKLDNILY